MTATTGGVPPATDTAPAGTGDPYTAALDELAGKAVTLYSSLHGARDAIGPRRQAVLADLHHQVRAMASVLNATLGALGWPSPEQPGPDPTPAEQEGPHQ